MKAEKFTHRQLQDYAIKKRLSRYYIHLVMKHKANQQYYGAECCTLQRIVFRKLKEVVFDGQRGLKNCEAIAVRLHGQYKTATIYERRYGQDWQPIAWFTDDQAPVIPLPKPAPVVKMQVVHSPNHITFIPQAA